MFGPGLPGQKTDFLPGPIRRGHELPNGLEDHPELFIIFLLSK
jgi:hypothetical protein